MEDDKFKLNDEEIEKITGGDSTDEERHEFVRLLRKVHELQSKVKSSDNPELYREQLANAQKELSEYSAMLWDKYH